MIPDTNFYGDPWQPAFHKPRGECERYRCDRPAGHPEWPGFCWTHGELCEKYQASKQREPAPQPLRHRQRKRLLRTEAKRSRLEVER